MDIFENAKDFYIEDLEDTGLDDLAKVFSGVTSLTDSNYSYGANGGLGGYTKWAFEYKGKTIRVPKDRVKLHLVVELVHEPTFFQAINNPSNVITCTDKEDHDYYASCTSTYKQVTIKPVV